MKTMKNIVSPHSQRIMGVIWICLLQLAVFVVVIYRFNQYFVYFYWICIVISLVVTIWIANRNGKLPYKVAWIIPILMFPFMGGLMFFLLGGARRPAKELRQRSRETFRRELFSTSHAEDLMFLGMDMVQQARYLETTALCPVYSGTETRYFPSGEEFYPVFLEELQKAEHYIFLEYFIISEGDMWSEILSILTQKAANGVDVRVIYDDMGSVTTLPRNYSRQLEKLGISCCVFRPVRPVLSIHQNNRDHRKICVIDGIKGFVGGLNLADEYINLLERFGYWKDSVLMLRGSAVWSLTVMFLNMWESLRKDPITYSDFHPKTLPTIHSFTGYVLPYMDTPLSTDTVCADLYLQMISKAKWYLYITTPYLVIDETISAALCVSARSGVDVRIMTPHIPDKKLVFSITQSNYEPLLRAGARIYEFQPGFIHSKTLVADDLYGTVGSCNLDYRSFYLQYENGVWLCGDPSVMAIRDDFLSSMSKCKEITLDDCRQISFVTRLLRSVLRFFSPLF